MSSNIWHSLGYFFTFFWYFIWHFEWFMWKFYLVFRSFLADQVTGALVGTLLGHLWVWVINMNLSCLIFRSILADRNWSHDQNWFLTDGNGNFKLDIGDDGADDGDGVVVNGDNDVTHCVNQHMQLVLRLVMMLSSQKQRFSSQLLRQSKIYRNCKMQI